MASRSSDAVQLSLVLIHHPRTSGKLYAVVDSSKIFQSDAGGALVFKMEPNMTFFVKDPRDKGISFGEGEEISCTVICTATDDDGTIEEFIAGLIQKV